MGWVGRIKGLVDRASDTLEDIQETGLPGSASKLLKSVSKVIDRYASGKEEEGSDKRHQ